MTELSKEFDMSILSCPIEDVTHTAGRLTRGLCAKHYQRWRKFGDVEGIKPKADIPAPGLPCQVCGEPLPPRHKMFCSVKCNSSAQYKKRKESGRAGKYADMAAFHAAIARPACSVDGCDRPHTARGFCLMHWKADRRREGVGWAVSGSDYKRRALQYGAEYERFDKREVFARDGWTCQICARPIDRSAKFPHPDSASLDHIIPISAGGPHRPENTQCTHLQCNMRKSSKLEVVNV